MLNYKLIKTILRVIIKAPNILILYCTHTYIHIPHGEFLALGKNSFKKFDQHVTNATKPI